MINETVLSRSIRLMFVGGIALGMQTAYAQDAAEQPMQKVEVTGSHIPSLNTEAASPVTVLSAKDIKIDGVRNVEDLLNNLPQVFADQGGSISNGATGTATVSLRGLGPDRTLVLVNGKRLPAGSVSSTAADLNEIPAGLIKRVDVLTGGAGAVYGAGAIAGVVNFIMKDNFEGVEVQGNTAGYNHNQHNSASSAVAAHNYPVPGDVGIDGKEKDASILMGSNFADGKGNATLYFSYKETKPVLEGTRDFSSCSLAVSKGTSYVCSGSGTNAGGHVGNFIAADAAGNARPYASATDAYNFGPINYLLRPSQNYNFAASAHLDVNDKIRVYQEFNFHNYSTDAQIAAGGIFYGGQYTLADDNPLLSQSWKNALGITAGNPAVVSLGKRNVEGGPRVDSINDNSFREVLGAKGEVNNFNYDVYAQYARVSHQESANGYFSLAKINNAIDVITDPKTGQPACRVAVNGTDTACVPYNLYKVGGVTQAALNYLEVSGHQQGYTQQVIYGGTVGADLSTYGVKSPFADGGAGVSFGLEHRVEKLVFNPDQENLSGDLSGGSGAAPPINASYSVKEAFGEFNMPLIEKKPWAESLMLSTSYRHSDYSTHHTANTYGLGLDWAPIKQVRLRGTYQRAVRAPTIQDLYNPQTIGLSGPGDDPCTGNTPKATAAQCANSGVSAAQYGHLLNNSANQYSGLTGGNPNLNPEIADTYTLGLVLEPIKDLTLTIDAFEIDIKNTISSVSPTTALNQCLQTGASVFCNLVKRDSQGSLWLSPNGPLGYVVDTTVNIGSENTNGVDLGAAYHLKMGTMGALDFTMNGTYLHAFKIENVPGLGIIDCKGYFGQTCLTPNPEWRHKFRTTWSTPWNFDVSATWRHFSSVTVDYLNPSDQVNDPASAAATKIENKLGERDYLDLNASYALTKKISISGGINNIFDRDPPVVSTNSTTPAGSANGNTFPQVYDSMGRYIYLNVTARF
ncbi:TonB-dependent receptor [Rugamonas sp.]|uniref:TonB-dependent receptor domain-containing protein n=1 Tax=Rugamonas sp. TaxID=1926287 RepID=UPI0025D3D471|nr:TonB-dependent receptor [Rugamonas sp.]